ncbi:uncharacterized protein LACBIDRAFT_332879 [Laccaria bicolor S238N-H82]|uniref:Predicted protein n=1 Tax=Laccaria bicolor (strain S238N-H82 / ATCC MYA-4686) TaxID=486041 RepID=B0DU51_LACBS|nr:uncharacterized protein LACBIDRAFT_332879 [Laccaria bicolor S238N-H82]EDR01886.1 predicted protein [Laccaria bicolor S238N-H82]|eukprot:XP_001887496.1 predicted protein [Laccaria bicolor S238N-H82]
MAAQAQAHYAEHVKNGIYESLLENLTTSGTGFLSSCECNTDFFHKTTWGADYQTSTGAEFRFNIFGEIQPESLGTKQGALGDFYIGSQSNPMYITKDSKIKNRFALGVPSNCPTKLSRLYDNQLVALNEVVEFERKQDLEEKKDYVVKEWITASKMDGPGDIITITSPYKYKSPEESEKRVPTIRRVMKRLRDVDVLDIDSHTDASPTESEGATSSHITSTYPEPKVGQLYPPTVLPDYKGKLFRNQECMLVQHEILDIDRKLIPPWDQYSALRTGTLIMATASLHCFTMKIRDVKGNPTGKERKIYQINFHRLLVIDGSVAEVPGFFIHPGYGTEENEYASNSKKEESFADRAMASFKIKKARTNVPSSVQKISTRPSASSSSSHASIKIKPLARSNAGKGKSTLAAHSVEKTPSDNTLLDEDHVMGNDD